MSRFALPKVTQLIFKFELMFSLVCEHSFGSSFATLASLQIGVTSLFSLLRLVLMKSPAPPPAAKLFCLILLFLQLRARGTATIAAAGKLLLFKWHGDQSIETERDKKERDAARALKGLLAADDDESNWKVEYVPSK